MAGAKVFVCPADPFSLNSPRRAEPFTATPGVQLFQDPDVHQRYQQLWEAATEMDSRLLLSDYNGSFIRWLVDRKKLRGRELFGMMSTSVASQQIYRQYVTGHTKIKTPMYYVPEYLMGNQNCYYKSTTKWLEEDMRDAEIESLSDKKALVVGFGQNGGKLAEFLKDKGATVYVAEKNPTLGVRCCLDGFSLRPLYSDGEPTDMVSEVDICLWTARHMGSCRTVVEALKPQATFLNYSGMSLAHDLTSPLKVVPKNSLMSRIVRPAGSYVNAALGLSPCNDPFYFSSPMMMDTVYSAELLLIWVLTKYPGTHTNLGMKKPKALPSMLQTHMARMFLHGYGHRLGMPKLKQLRPRPFQILDPKHYEWDESMEFSEE